MDISTTYLGLRLPHPLVVGASPLTDDLDMVKRLEDRGAAALTMRSLFEEQILAEQRATVHHLEVHNDANAEALSYFPEPGEYRLGPDAYLRKLARIKETVRIPVIASINGTTGEGWVEYAKLMQQAGADGLELNIYFMSTHVEESAAVIEDRIVDIVRSVTTAVPLPVAVKLSPFFSSLPHLARRLAEAGAKGLVLFNRFYQPDIDPEALDVAPKLVLSDSHELLLRLRWIAILHGRTNLDLIASGGVHHALDAVKALMAGARGVQMVSALLRHGPSKLAQVKNELSRFLEEHEYDSLAQMLGSMSLERCPNPAAFERANYARILQTWES